MSIGPWQVILILLLVVLLFGAGKIPRLMGDVAKGIKAFRTGIKDDDQADPKAIENSAHRDTAAEPAASKDETVKS